MATDMSAKIVGLQQMIGLVSMSEEDIRALEERLSDRGVLDEHPDAVLMLAEIRVRLLMVYKGLCARVDTSQLPEEPTCDASAPKPN